MATEYILYNQFCGDPAQIVKNTNSFVAAEDGYNREFINDRNPFICVEIGGVVTRTLRSPDDVESYRIALERNAAWKPIVMPTQTTTPVTRPNYYKEYVPTMEWLEAMQYIPSFRDRTAFLGGVEMLARKYLDRRGGKDPDLQEVMKALWYFKFMAAYMRAGRNIKISEIDEILRDPL